MSDDKKWNDTKSPEPGLAEKFDLMEVDPCYETDMRLKKDFLTVQDGLKPGEEPDPEETKRRAQAGMAPRRSLSVHEADERYKRIERVEKICKDGLSTTVGSCQPPDWEELLCDTENGEQVVGKLDCLAFKGMPGKPDGTTLGKALLLLTKMQTKAGTTRHRLYFAVKSADAKFKGKEAWGKKNSGNCCCRVIKSQVQFDYTFVQNQAMHFCVLDVEKNLFHTHVDVTDASELISSAFKEDPGRYCCECLFECCKCCKCCKCPSCCPLPCCAKPPDIFGSWFASSSFKESLEKVTKKVQEEVKAEPKYTFPQVGEMTVDVERAIVSDQLHCFHFVYRCSGNNGVKPAVAVVSPDEDITKIVQFFSYLSYEVLYNPQKGPNPESWSLTTISVGGGWGR